jgi:DNA-binding response OmpR family regulator
LWFEVGITFRLGEGPVWWLSNWWEIEMSNAVSNRILLIDPDLDAVAVLKTYFEGHAYEVRLGETGQDGLALAKSWQPNAILIDSLLVDMPLNTLCENLMDVPLTAHIPILVLLNLENRRTKLEMLELGVADLIIKPYDIEELMLRVNAAIHLATILE